MTCPHCQAQTDAAAENCFTCGKPLFSSTSITRGALIHSRYEILAPLGKGGMGMVYKAHDRVLDETVALKVLRADVARAGDMARRFRSEIKLARKVRHKNVCGIHEYGEDGDLRFIAMEFIEGVDFRRLLNERGALPAAEAFDICVQIALGLEAIHEAGIIHRDLKTPNIMRDARGTVRLMDFGIAKQAGVDATLGGTAVGMIVGTPEYMSPEQARGEKIDFRSDIYALGVVVFEVFTGQVPFRGETPIATIFKHLQDAPPLEGPRGASLPAALVPILRRALAKDPAERYPAVVEMVEALKQARATTFPALAQGPVSGSHPTPHTPPPIAYARFGTVAPAPSAREAPRTEVPTSVATPVPTSVSRPASPGVTERVPTPLPHPTTSPPPESEQDKRDRERAAAQQREVSLRRLRAQAEEWAATGRLEQAKAAVREVLTLEPADRSAQELASRIEGLLQRRVQEERRARAVAEAQASVERELQRGDLVQAERTLADAQSAYGSEPFVALRTRVEELRRRERDAAIRQLLAQAEQLASLQQLEQAQELVRQALAIRPDERSAQRLAAALQERARQRAEEQRRAQAVAAAAERIESLLARQSLSEADAELSAAERAYAGVEALRTLRGRLRELQRQEQRAAEARRAAEAQAARQRQTEPASAPPDAPPAGVAARRPAGLVVALAGGGLAALIVAGLVVWRFSASRGPVASPTPIASSAAATPQPSASPRPSTAAPGAAGLTGVLLLDALPWGEVVEIVDSKGRRQPVGPAAYTPLSLSLPPGQYTVSIRNPDFPRPLSLSATVAAANVERCFGEFRKVDAAEYFRRAGW